MGFAEIWSSHFYLPGRSKSDANSEFVDTFGFNEDLAVGVIQEFLDLLEGTRWKTL